MPRAKKNYINPDELWGVVLLAVSLFLLLSFSSYNPNDISYYLSPPNSPAKNLMGPIGAWTGFGFYFLFGLSAYLMPLTTFCLGISRLRKIHLRKRPDIYIFAWCLSSISLCGLLAITGKVLNFKPDILTHWKLIGMGGLVGAVIGENFLIRYFGNAGSILIMSTIFGISFFYITGIKFWLLFVRIPRLLIEGIKGTAKLFATAFKALKSWYLKKRGETPKTRPLVSTTRTKPEIKIAGQKIKESAPLPCPVEKPERPKEKPALSTPPQQERPPSMSLAKTTGPAQDAYRLPPIDILEPPPAVTERDIKEDLSQGAKILETTLKDFGINVQVTNIQRGPVVTLYEMVLAPGTKIGKITGLSDDIALSMRVGTVRIIAPIPGKAAIGIEVPNVKPRFVFIKEVFGSPEFQNTNAKIPMAIGMDIAGNPLITDLADMPHLLIAGTTGSGKTVCLNAIILSILFKLAPVQVKLFMVDPKMVELAPYRNLPHLLVPLVHQPKKAALGLNWVVREMERRYELFARVGVRNIEGYNTRQDKDSSANTVPEMAEGLTDLDYEKITPATIPYIVIIIDELADLMMVAPADIETAIGRLAQLSRAVGIHIILATQRPSVDVLTGVIKANFSTRISFQVASRIDSRTVLDSGGADMLLGKGDLLFMPPGSSKLIRAQGALVRDVEITRIVNFIVSQKKAPFTSQQTNEGVFQKIQKEQEELGEEDPLFQQAIDVILTTQQPSASVLQRKLKIGYNRAARIVDLLEARGIVSPLVDGKREILMDRSELMEK